MPRYYFRIEPDGPFDAEGEELPNDRAAAKMAALIVEDLTKNHREWGAGRLLVVFDSEGRLVEQHELSPEHCLQSSPNVISFRPLRER